MGVSVIEAVPPIENITDIFVSPTMDFFLYDIFEHLRKMLGFYLIKDT